MKTTKFWITLMFAFIISCNFACSKTEAGVLNTGKSPISKEQVLTAWDKMSKMVVGSTSKMPKENFFFKFQLKQVYRFYLIYNMIKYF